MMIAFQIVEQEVGCTSLFLCTHQHICIIYEYSMFLIFRFLVWTAEVSICKWRTFTILFQQFALIQIKSGNICEYVRRCFACSLYFCMLHDVFVWRLCCSIFSSYLCSALYIMVRRFSLGLLYCLSIDLLHLITPLISSNFFN